MEKIKKIGIKVIIMIICSFILLSSLTEADSNMAQYLNQIDYQVTLDEKGNMQVVETWDINVRDTNTLFRDFTLSGYKYGDIIDVEIIDLQSNIKLEKINIEQYHVPENKYYALKTNSTTFEIAWGVGMDHEFGNRKYQISYVITNVVNDYEDCQEIYWQFLEKGKNAIPAKEVTGRLILPEDVSNIDNLRVWGHGQLNGEIKKVNEHEVTFSMKKLASGSMFEIRVVTEDKIFNVPKNKIKNYSKLKNIINEETNWSDKANKSIKSERTTLITSLIVYGVILLIFVFQIIKYKRIVKKENDGIRKIELEYYREIPREETVTPAEAAYLHYFEKQRLETKSVQINAVSSTILDLCLKKQIGLRVDAQNNVYVKILEQGKDLKKDELAILKLLKRTAKGREEFEITELNNYAKNNYNEYSNQINLLVSSARNNLYNLGLIDKAEEKLYNTCQNAKIQYSIIKNLYLFIILNHIMTYIPTIRLKLITNYGIQIQDTIFTIILILLPIVGLWLYTLRLKTKLQNKIAVLTQKGSDEKAQWKGLERYLKNYSLLKDKEVPDLVIWEKYLVYATALGIADKVVEQMKAAYPQVFIKERWDENEMMEKYPIINFVYNPSYINTYTQFTMINSISRNVESAYKTSQRQISLHTHSSGTGGGGGFSGGGGGRWRPVAGMGGR